MTETSDDKTQDDAAPKAAPDWTRLANEALDLWQNHLTALASDAKAKEDMARMVAPMTQMFMQWTDMMQQGLHSVNAYPAAAQPATTAQPHEPAADPAAAARDVGGDAQPDAGQPVADAAAGESVKPVASEPASPFAVSFAVPPIPVPEPAVEQRPVVAQPAVLQPAVVEPVAGPVVVQQQPAPVAADDAATRGRPASTDSGRDLARLAGRLAELERELEGMRARSRKQRADDADQRADAGDVQRVAGTGTGTTAS